MAKDSQNNSLAYHLAEATTSYIYASGARLAKRTDLLVFMAACTDAMLDWVTEDKETISSLAEIEDAIQALQDSYEPIIDEMADTMVDKRRAYSEFQRSTLKRILTLIRQHNLVSNSIMREISASRWGRRSNVDD